MYMKFICCTVCAPLYIQTGGLLDAVILLQADDRRRRAKYHALPETKSGTQRRGTHNTLASSGFIDITPLQSALDDWSYERGERAQCGDLEGGPKK